MANFKSDITFLGLDIKKELLKIILINIVIIALLLCSYFLFDQIYIFLFACVGCVVIEYMLFTSYSSKKAQVLKKRDDEFVSIISYFQILINHNSNVYHAFESLIEYSSEWMANEITNFLKDIDRDKSVQPFINFAHQFNTPIIENVMLSIFQMVDEGEDSEKVNHFSLVFSDFSHNHKEEK